MTSTRKQALKVKKEKMKNFQDSESLRSRSDRLRDLRERQRHRRAHESEEERYKRLEHHREKSRNVRSNSNTITPNNKDEPPPHPPQSDNMINVETGEVERNKRNNARQGKKRSLESAEVRSARLEKSRTSARTRRACETVLQRNERLSKVKVPQKRKHDEQEPKPISCKPLSSSRKEELWRLINQNLKPNNNDTIRDLASLAKSCERDLKKFKQTTISPLYSNICAICGLTIERDGIVFEINHSIFDPIRNISPATSLNNKDKWCRFGSMQTKDVSACFTCITTLKRKSNNIPRFSRANIPLPNPAVELQDLTFIEQMLISPVLPMVFVWRYKSFGKHQSKGQCVAFRNQIQRVAEILPRTLTEVFVNIKDIYGHMDIAIRVKKLREALMFLKLNHSAYENIQISERNLETIKVTCDRMAGMDRGSPGNKEIPEASSEKLSRTQIVRDSGQNQIVEEHVAQVALTSPLTVEVFASKEEVSETIKGLFKSMADKDSRKYASGSILEGWSVMFPCLLWNGQGGPDSCLHRQISLREWVNYVIRIPFLHFRKNVIFISFANIVLRRQRITGLTAHNPISKSVEQAVKELIQIPQSESPSTVPEVTLESLSRKVGTYVDELPGSLSDMRKFRNDILSMKKKHGPPSYFLTRSSADSMWPEGFIEAINGKITMEAAKNLSAFERADLMAKHPVAMTISWKRKVRAFLDFVIKGESKPLGDINHYVQKAEWQGRLSEHVHFLFWTKEGIPPLCLHENEDLKGQQEKIAFKAESVASAMIHYYKHASESKDEYVISRPGIDCSDEDHFQKPDIKALPREEIYHSITQEPCSLQNYFSDGRARKSVNDLIRAVNIHTCSAYCTDSGKKTCKSKFPFQIKRHTLVRKAVDKNLNQSYRINLRRNHSRINPLSVPVINFWRANMDLTVLCGSPFASIVYVTYYTLKLDKSSNIRDVLQKVKKLDETTETNVILRKLLINMDTCRATGLPEASSNLLLFPHRYTSSKIVRIDTRAYLPSDESEKEENSETLNRLLHEATKDNEGFALPDPELYKNPTGRLLTDRITQSYFDRPATVYGIGQNKMIDSRYLSMTEYIENYKVTKKRTIKNEKQARDKNGKIVEPRDSVDQDVVLDLKFRISPPDRKDPKWCAGTLALHVPHVSIKDLLTINGGEKDVIGAYEYYYSRKNINEKGECVPLYPSLHKFEKNETDIFAAKNATKHLPLQLTNRKKQDIRHGVDCLYDEEVENSFEDDNISELRDLDPDDYSPALTKASTDLKNELCKSWNGLPKEKFLSAENPWSVLHEESLTVNEISEIPEEHRTFMSRVAAEENPGSSNANLEVEEALLYAKGDRKAAAEQFLQRTMIECKNDEQRKAMKMTADLLETYYYGHHNTNIPVASLKHTPILTLNTRLDKLRAHLGH